MDDASEPGNVAGWMGWFLHGSGSHPNLALDETPRPGFNARLPRVAVRLAISGRVAQLVEQGTENPRVGGSIPSPATTLQKFRFSGGLRS